MSKNSLNPRKIRSYTTTSKWAIRHARSNAISSHICQPLRKIRHFLPEIARRLGSRFFTKTLELSKDMVLDFAANPVEILDEILTGLSRDNRAALALIFMNNGRK